MTESFLAPQWPIFVPYCGMDIRKSHFSLISGTFSVGGCWGQPMSFFWKLVDETQMSNPLEAASYRNSTKLLILLPLRAIYFYSLCYETPCMYLWTADENECAGVGALEWNSSFKKYFNPFCWASKKDLVFHIFPPNGLLLSTCP